jgi:hypothetical protein
MARVARSKIESGWEDVAKNYTVGWAGPLEAVEIEFPYVSNGITNIRSNISSILPFIIYQTRKSPPEQTSIAVPYISDGDPYKCCLLATDELTSLHRILLREFAQAIWFLIVTGALPDPSEGSGFESHLIEWIDTVGVWGSNPHAPTNSINKLRPLPSVFYAPKRSNCLPSFSKRFSEIFTLIAVSLSP